MGNTNKQRAIKNNTYIFQRRKKLDSIKKLHEINPRTAKKELILHMEEYPEDMYAKFYYGKLCEEESLFDEAEEYYRIVASSDCNNRVAGIFGLAEVYKKKGNYPLAKEYYYKSILESDKEQKPAVFNLARLERIDKHFQKALDLLDSLKEQDSNVLIEKIKILCEQNRYQEALHLAKNIIPENSDQARIINYNIGKMYFLCKEYDQARIYFDKAKENAPIDIIYHKTLSEEGKMYVELKEYNDAIKNFSEILKNGEELCGEVNFQLGKCYQELGKYQEAMENYYKATQSTAVNDSMKGMNYMYLAKLESIAGENEKALEHFEQCLRLNGRAQPETVPFIVNSIIYLNIILERYDVGLDYIYKYKDYDGISKEQLDLYRFLIKKSNNIAITEKPYHYREKQIINYNKREAINHIKNHHGKTTENSFSDNIDIDMLFEEISEKLSDDNITLSDGLEKHSIEYPNIGQIAGKAIDRISVIVIPKTKKIITMFPDETPMITRKDILNTCTKKNKEQNERIKKFNERFKKFNGTKH